MFHISYYSEGGGGGGDFHRLVNGDVPFLGYLFEPIFDLWVSFLASSEFLGAILSHLRIYGYTFEKNCLKIIFPALLMLGALRGSCFQDLWVSFSGSAAGFLGAIFKAKMAHPV